MHLLAFHDFLKPSETLGAGLLRAFRRLPTAARRARLQLLEAYEARGPVHKTGAVVKGGEVLASPGRAEPGCDEHLHVLACERSNT